MSTDPSLIRTEDGDDGVQFGTEERSVLRMGRAKGDAPRIFPAGIDPSLYTLEQLAFLSRKEQGIMPTGHDCSCCDGVGTVICHSCRGQAGNQPAEPGVQVRRRGSAQQQRHAGRGGGHDDA